MNRRDFYRYGTVVVGNLVGLGLAIPGVAYLLDPIFKKKDEAGAFQEVAKLSDLKVGVPMSVPIIEQRQDAWVNYPKEAISSVWLVRQPPCNSKETVIALSSECPHLGCAVSLGEDGQSFFCPCHTSSFDLCGKATNKIPPRPMDGLEVTLSNDKDPKIQVKFQRFRAQSEEQIPLV
ncbi:menaquinol-cytochrome c reductase iron-sulfur subunit [Singulisphaera sp. GP187]|uniref:QcrA and Rieske domain-containing protein n=1 Tax=Singulisphaera sp. GP187 TaxID=1882752 RepID=UPI00092B64F2|nr:Rieske (2Fe-2S) protein [Singulisphaera sp. GP187]SIO17828.1 menaquinol-cytochrome c reductase iron-sulfur subunit [Singulisphaera sp. GP187]